MSTPRGPELDAIVRATQLTVDERLVAASECILTLVASVMRLEARLDDTERRLARLEKRDEYR